MTKKNDMVENRKEYKEAMTVLMLEKPVDAIVNEDLDKLLFC